MLTQDRRFVRRAWRGRHLGSRRTAWQRNAGNCTLWHFVISAAHQTSIRR